MNMRRMSSKGTYQYLEFIGGTCLVRIEASRLRLPPAYWAFCFAACERPLTESRRSIVMAAALELPTLLLLLVLLILGGHFAVAHCFDFLRAGSAGRDLTPCRCWA